MLILIFIDMFAPKNAPMDSQKPDFLLNASQLSSFILIISWRFFDHAAIVFSGQCINIPLHHMYPMHFSISLQFFQ